MEIITETIHKKGELSIKIHSWVQHRGNIKEQLQGHIKWPSLQVPL